MLALFRQQPLAFRMIFMLEIWERFGYYTVQGILTLYFVRFLGFSDEKAYFTFGAFSALVYGLVPLGGYLGDKLLGTKRTIVLGLFSLTLGYLALSLVNESQVFLALGLVCVGNGLFKANPSSLLAKAYAPGDLRLHGGFTLYYMAINLGSTVALLMGPTLATRFGYSYAYFASFIGLVLGLSNYYFQRRLIKDIHTPMDEKKLTLFSWSLILLSLILVARFAAYLLEDILLAKRLVLVLTFGVVLTYLVYLFRESKASALRMTVALILMCEAVVFFTLYQQMPTSLTVFAVHHARTELFGFHLDAQSYQALNPIWIIVLSPILAMIYQRLNQRHVEFSIAHKFALGMTLAGLSFLLLYFPRFFYDVNYQVSPWWLVWSYFFQSSGELLVSALGVAMVAELAPASIAGFVMGMWFLTSAVAGFIGASVASYTALPMDLKPGLESLYIYTRVFAYIGFCTLFIALLLWFFASFLSKIIKGKDEKIKT